MSPPPASPAASGAAPLGRLPWLVVAALAAHMLEEWARFPEWATRHFGTTTPGFYLISHIPIVAIVAWSAGRSARPAVTRNDLWFLAVIIVALLTNTVFHLGTTALFREYSPGLVTAVICYIPLAALLLPRIGNAVGRTGTVRATFTGVLLSALITASLALEMTWP